ncbi:MAG: hypothetical protein H6812_04560 [Phycisphaeraceae bacterium]|nr:hypothetical protein [Phycisphaerales bacterium]MCB9842510.1 hypothetical protein [Phycisphaeraceae bacterium]
MRHHNHPAISSEMESPDAIQRGPYSGEMRDESGMLTDRAPVWGEPRPRRWPATVN